MKNEIRLPVFFFLIVAISSLMSGCRDQAGKQEMAASEYIDIEAMVNFLQNDLSKINPKVTKVSFFNGNKDTVILGNVDWKKELLPYAAIYLHKPSLKGAFIYVSKMKDSTILLMYHKKKDAKTDIEFINAYYTHSNKILSIRSKVVSKNLIFDAIKNYEFDFDTSSTKSLALKSYSIQGNQGFVFSKRDWYRIHCTIKY